jgi:hypothetical protein
MTVARAKDLPVTDALTLIQPNSATKDYSKVAPAAAEPSVAPHATVPKPTPTVSSVTKA